MNADETRGLYPKYNVTRTDGSSKEGGKHEHCMYYVLDLDHDPHALAALGTYILDCEKDFPLLARDLKKLLVDRGYVVKPRMKGDGRSIVAFARGDSKK